MKLLIVESPNKTKKIASYLGKDWQIEASYGHIRDLPVHDIGVTGPDYWPNYVTGEKSGKTVAKLKKLAQSAQEIYLATDPDREGEAIAWHLSQVLGKDKRYFRVTFNEITPRAIKQAIANPRQIDKRLFLAQQGRRVLDRLFGYKVSPALGSKLGQRGLSAGRVQSVALRLVVEREEAIRHFSKTKHYSVTLQFSTTTEGEQWMARWVIPSHLLKEEQPYLTDKSIAETVLQVALAGVEVKDFAEKEQSRKPPAPFTTSTLQQAASVQLHIGVDDTMKAAQALFEAGLITYHRTDNPNLSEEAIQAIWDYLRERGQTDYIPEKPNTWQAKADAQEAHEAIRPTDVRVYKADTGNELYDKLYKMIYRRAVASQMKAAVFKVRSAQLESIQSVAGIGKQIFQAHGQELLFDGWMKLSNEDYTTEEAEESTRQLPILTPNQQIKPDSGQVLEQETKPPKRFTEAALVKALEKEGIGRPSTYASIITTLKKRDYVNIVKRCFEPTPVGQAIVHSLKGHFAFMEISYTREMEEQLDAIAQGKIDYQTTIAHYDQALDGQLSEFTDSHIMALSSDEPTYPCPNCETGHLRRIKGNKGYFWGCSNYAHESAPCKTSLPDDNGKPGKKYEKNLDHPCPSCGEGYLQRRKSKKGFFWGCDHYPDCTQTFPDKRGKPDMQPSGTQEAYTCGACGGVLRLRKGAKGNFWGCSNYPDCKHTEPDVKGKPKFAGS